MFAELGTSLIIMFFSQMVADFFFLRFLGECLKGKYFADGLDFFNSNQVRSLFTWQQIQVLIIEALLYVIVGMEVRGAVTHGGSHGPCPLGFGPFCNLLPLTGYVWDL